MSAWVPGVVRVDISGKPDAEEYVRELTGNDLDAVMLAFPGGQDANQEMASAVILFCCDADGNPKFTEDDREKILAAPITTITAIAERAMQLNGLDEAGEDLIDGQ